MRTRLVLLVTATVSLVLVAFLAPLAILVRTTAEDRAMSSAIVEAQALVPTVAGVDQASLALTIAQTNAVSQYPVTVFLAGGRVIGVAAPRSTAVDLAATGRSISAETSGGREILVAVDGLDEGTAVIRTFVSDDQLHQGVSRAWLVLGLLGLGLLGLSLVVADQLARALIRPISALAEVSYRLAHGNLSARAAPTGPAEVRLVGAGLNLLANRIGELLNAERESVADLSHRLRTPLTALRIDAESISEPGERAQIMADLDAVERTVNEVIREGRRPVREGIAAACDATEVVAGRAEFWSVLAEEEGRRMRVTLPAQALPVRVGADDLSAAVDALLGNVFAHTSEGVDFSVSLGPGPAGGAELVVADDGPGLPDAPVLRRGHSGGGSTGLGLDIVHRTAVSSGGEVLLGRSSSGGARVEVRFGATPPPVLRRHRRSRRATRLSGTSDRPR